MRKYWVSKFWIFRLFPIIDNLSNSLINISHIHFWVYMLFKAIIKFLPSKVDGCSNCIRIFVAYCQITHHKNCIPFTFLPSSEWEHLWFCSMPNTANRCACVCIYQYCSKQNWKNYYGQKMALHFHFVPRLLSLVDPFKMWSNMKEGKGTWKKTNKSNRLTAI